jgi:hypothetical protein
MIQNRLPLVAALLVPALLSSHVPVDRIRFAPSEGSSAKKTFENKAEFTLDHLSLSMNGQESPMQPEMEMTLNSTQKVVVTDEYVANREGAPKKLRRTFDELGNGVTMAMKMEMMGQTQNHDQDIKGESELQGKKVVFTWDEEKKEYTKAFDASEGKDSLLKDLEEDMDLRALLPKGEVKEGEEWELDVSSLASVLAPGGNLSILRRTWIPTRWRWACPAWAACRTGCAGPWKAARRASSRRCAKSTASSSRPSRSWPSSPSRRT